MLNHLHWQSQCPYMTRKGRFEQRRDELLDNVKRHQVNGAVFTIQRFCDPHQLDYPDLNRALEDQGIPTLLIETEQTVDIEPIKNRLAAFIEILKQQRRILICLPKPLHQKQKGGKRTSG